MIADHTKNRKNSATLGLMDAKVYSTNDSDEAQLDMPELLLVRCMNGRDHFWTSQIPIDSCESRLAQGLPTAN